MATARWAPKAPRRAPKSKILHIRFTPEERKRIYLAAAAEFLEPSTWARQIILEAILNPESDDDDDAADEEAPPGDE